jgi:hypothetical protein
MPEPAMIPQRAPPIDDKLARIMGEKLMNKKQTESTTRRRFVKEVAAGTTALAVAGAFAAEASPVSQGGSKASASLEERLAAVEKRLQHLEDIQAINRLQYAYNYYVEHMMKQEIIDCFSDSPDVLLDWLEGKWKGKAGVRKYFNVNQTPPAGFRHQLMPISGLITVAPDGKTAKGRWYAFGAHLNTRQRQTEEKPFSAAFVNGIYEMGYIKEDGVWKILSINWVIPYSVSITGGWRMPEDIGGPMLKALSAPGGPKFVADVPMDKEDLRYVTGYIFPFHFNHPVTGKATSEAKLNARLKPISQ